MAAGSAFPDLAELPGVFGDLDIYLFDQLLKGRIRRQDRVLDAGCGSGRNLAYLLRCGVDCYGTDRSAEAVEEARRLAGELAPGLGEDRFRVEPVAAMSFPDAFFDAVISAAVLHFSGSEEQAEQTVREMGRVLKPGGMLFVRLGSTIGIEDHLEPRGGRRFKQPEGSVRFLVDRELLWAWTRLLSGRLLEPIKTTVVDGQRAMTTWVVRKG